MDFFAEQERFIARVASSRSQVQKRARWEARGDRYMQAWGGVRPGQMITVDPGLQRATLRWMAAIAPALSRAFNDHLVPVAGRAFDEWPVDTGMSKSQLDLVFEDVGGVFYGRILNRAPYAWFIVTRSGAPRGEVVRRLIFEPGAEAAGRIAQDAASEIAQVFR